MALADVFFIIPVYICPLNGSKKTEHLPQVYCAPVHTGISLKCLVFGQMTYASTISGIGVCGTGIGGLALSLVGFPMNIDLHIAHRMLIRELSHRSPKS